MALPREPPKSEAFIAYVRARAPGNIEFGKPKQTHVWTQWPLELGGKVIGTYYISADSSMPWRQYEGQIPGYVNVSIARNKEHLEYPENWVTLLYDLTDKFDKTSWGRIDDHSEIPF